MPQCSPTDGAGRVLHATVAGGGLIELNELSRILRRGASADIQLKAELQAGAMGEIALKGKNKIALRQSARDGAKARTGLVASIPAIKAAMAEDLFRVKDLMNALDCDEDGHVTKEVGAHTPPPYSQAQSPLASPHPPFARAKCTPSCSRGASFCCSSPFGGPVIPCERHPALDRLGRAGLAQEFRKILPRLGFDAGGTDAIDALFDSFDADRSGSVEYAELHKLLRKAANEPKRSVKDGEVFESSPLEVLAATRIQAIHRGRSARGVE